MNRGVPLTRTSTPSSITSKSTSNDAEEISAAVRLKVVEPIVIFGVVPAKNPSTISALAVEENKGSVMPSITIANVLKTKEQHIIVFNVDVELNSRSRRDA